MATTALLVGFWTVGITAGVGIGYGWQPMPDGSPRVEYIVQMSPEMISMLQSGQSIPIVSEVPARIGPVGRVRIVIGTDDLPRQGLQVETTQLKPQPGGGSESAAAPESGLLQAEFRQPVDTALPGGPDQTDPAAAPRTRVARQFTSPPSTRLQPANKPATTESTIAPNGRYSNAGSPTTLSPAAAYPWDRTEGSAAKSMTSAQPAPPNEPAVDGGSFWATGLNQTQTPGETPPAGENALQDSAARINQRANEIKNAAERIRQGQDYTETPQNRPWSDTAARRQAASTEPGNRAAQSDPSGQGGPTETDNWNNPPGNWNDPASRNARARFAQAPTSSNRSPQTEATTLSLGFPPGQPAYAKTESTNRGAASAESIRRDMLNQPANAPVGPVTSQSQESFLGNDWPDPANPSHHNPPPNVEGGTRESRPNNRSRQLTEDDQTQTDGQQTESGGPISIFSLLLAWVLLTGSVGGNVYLFWSYLDVRGKYQSVVRSARSSLYTSTTSSING
jgi:hypothetical protein